MISAAPMPRRRAFTRCCGGSLFVRIEMKIRLSMPSTTSMAISVTMRRPALGVARNAEAQFGHGLDILASWMLVGVSR